MAKIPKLFFYPEKQEFASGEFSLLRSALADVASNTIVTPPAHSSELCLTPAGVTARGGFRYTAIAFHRICQAACSGLSRVIPDVAGQFRKPDASPEAFDIRSAIDIFNTVVRLRFSTEFANRRIVINRKTKVIEGLLGPKTRYLENMQMLELVEELFDGRAFEFAEAVLASRQLLVRMVATEPFFVSGDDSLFHGYHFSNTESGDGSIRGGGLVYRPLSDSSSLAVVDVKGSAKLVHAGKGMLRRLHEFATDVATREPKVSANDVTRLMGQSLSLPVSDPYEVRKRIQSLVKKFVSAGVKSQLAERVVRRAVYAGSSSIEISNAERNWTRSGLSSRTLYDLYNATGIEAAGLNIASRENLERVAFDVLTGTLSIK